MSEPVARARHTETEALFDLRLGTEGELIATLAGVSGGPTFIGDVPNAARDPELVGRWRHFKGGVYEFVARAEGLEGALVLYLDNGGSAWLRPLAMVNEIVERDGGRRARFLRITGRE